MRIRHAGTMISPRLYAPEKLGFSSDMRIQLRAQHLHYH